MLTIFAIQQEMMTGQYHTGPTDEKLWTRYDACEDFAGQLAAHASRKMFGFGLSLDNALSRVEKGVKTKASANGISLLPR